MTRKRKEKNILMTHEAHEYLRRRLHRRIIPYNPTIVDGKIKNYKSEVKKEDDD